MDVVFPVLLFTAGLWWLVVRPQQAREREAAVLRDSLQVGADVVTTSGLHGRVHEIDNDANTVDLLVQANPDVRLRFALGAIAHLAAGASEGDSEVDDVLDLDEASSVVGGAA